MTRPGPTLGLCSREELGGLASIQDGADGSTKVLQSPCDRVRIEIRKAVRVREPRTVLRGKAVM